MLWMSISLHHFPPKFISFLGLVYLLILKSKTGLLPPKYAMYITHQLQCFKNLRLENTNNGFGSLLITSIRYNPYRRSLPSKVILLQGSLNLSIWFYLFIFILFGTNLQIWLLDIKFLIAKLQIDFKIVKKGYFFHVQKARDAFYACIEKESNKKPTEIASVGLLYPAECKKNREAYVKQCRPTWVILLLWEILANLGLFLVMWVFTFWGILFVGEAFW